jgi:hypothetical protein
MQVSKAKIYSLEGRPVLHSVPFPIPKPRDLAACDNTVPADFERGPLETAANPPIRQRAGESPAAEFRDCASDEGKRTVGDL